MRQFSPQEFQAKCKMDIPLFAELFKNYLTESEIPVFTDLLIKTYDLAQELHEEANVLPQVSLVSLRSKRKLQSLTENEINNLVYNSFRTKIDTEYVEPLTNNRIVTLNENDVNKIVSVIVKSNTDLDPEISKKYGIFEKIIGSTLKDIILPKDTILNLKDYAEKVSPEYYEIFDKNIKTVKAEFNEAVNNLVRNLAIKMFKCGAQIADKENIADLKLDDYKGISSFIMGKDELDETLDKIDISFKPTLDEEELDKVLKS